jgi:predicted P-loop ATPase
VSAKSVTELDEFRRGYDDDRWKAQLVRQGEQGRALGDERNVLQALRTAPALSGLIRYNEFALSVEFTRSAPWRECTLGAQWSDDDDTALMSYLQDQGVSVRGKNIVTDCVSLVAKDARVHPVREYLHGIVWDGIERLDSWLGVYLGATGNDDYLAAVGMCWLTSAVARVENPGCQADHMLVLEGQQGLGKSRAARLIAVLPEWFADNVGDLRNKDSALQLSGKWIIELSELAAIRRGELEQVKAFISRTQDVFRPPYGRRSVTVPRQAVFIGTTNETAYLRDRTGNRRYWPVTCGLIDLGALQRDRDQLWAEAMHRYTKGEPWHLSDAISALAATEQEERVAHTELEADVAEYLDRMLESGTTTVSSRDVFVFALRLDPSTPSFAEQATRLGTEVASAIERAGWRKLRRSGRGENRRTLYVPRVTKVR